MSCNFECTTSVKLLVTILECSTNKDLPSHGQKVFSDVKDYCRHNCKHYLALKLKLSWGEQEK